MSSPWETAPEAQWLRTGSSLLAATLADVNAEQLTEDSLLPDWSRAYVVSHVSANAQAIGRLLLGQNRRADPDVPLHARPGPGNR
jgi:hypothetical protein